MNLEIVSCSNCRHLEREVLCSGEIGTWLCGFISGKPFIGGDARHKPPNTPDWCPVKTSERAGYRDSDA